ncbi:MAG: MaoC family dehydratase N-terminal domain-containing protein [Actinomycetes bacterium]
MLDPDLVGRTFVGASSTVVTQEAITNFARVLGAENFDVAPPTFSISITLAQSQTLLQESGLDWSRVVHGDQRFVLSRPIVAGDNFICSATIESARVMAGNEIVTVRSDLHSGTELVVSTWSTLVVRA